MRTGIPGKITSFPLEFTPGQLQRYGPGPPFVFAYRDVKERETNGLTSGPLPFHRHIQRDTCSSSSAVLTRFTT